MMSTHRAQTMGATAKESGGDYTEHPSSSCG